MRRIICLLLILCCLLPALASAEDALTLRTADSVDEVNQFLLLPTADAIPAPQAGYIRFVSLNPKDRAFRADLWQNARFDLMNKGSYRADYRNMHNRAAYCMALSYLGIGMTPVMMSEMVGSRDVTAPFDAVTAQIPGLERVEVKAYTFDTMVENYLSDSSYSPVYCQVRKPNGALHTVLIVGYIPATGGFIICDPAAPWKDGVYFHSYKMAWHVMRQVVLSSEFYDAFYASDVVALYQWRLAGE